jgi:hypothetical protein
MLAVDGPGILERGVWESYFRAVIALLTTPHSTHFLRGFQSTKPILSLLLEAIYYPILAKFRKYFI